MHTRTLTIAGSLPKRICLGVDAVANMRKRNRGAPKQHSFHKGQPSGTVMPEYIESAREA